MDGAPLMNRLDNDHHGTQMPIVSAVHTITLFSVFSRNLWLAN